MNIFTSKSLETYEIIPGIAGALISLTFILYCIVMGLQDWRNEQLIHAKYFNLFGLFFEILISFVGLYIFIFILIGKTDFWQIALYAFWNVGILILTFVDVKRMWIGKREYSND